MANYYTEFSTVIRGTKKQAEWLYDKLQERELESDDDAGFCYFEVEDLGVWIHGEYGLPEWVVEATQLYLAKFYPEHVLSIEWGHFCSKPRVDGFGGGGVVFSATNEEWWDSSTFVAKTIKEMKNDT